MLSVAALSWKIATEPKLYRQLSPNPYSKTTQQIISDRFPNASISDITLAIVLAEPQGRYDRNFRQLEKAEQAKELGKQISITAKINIRLDRYCKNHTKELSRQSLESIYDSLFLVVFESSGLIEIELRYSQDQRRDFKLSIVNFIAKQETKRQLENKKWAPQRLLLKGVFAAATLVLLFCLQTQNITQQPQSKQILGTNTQTENPGLPVRLKIPSINVDASVEDIGITSTGAMGVPNNPLDVGWFDLGARPGEKGSGVIAGHLNGKNGEDGVFTNLHKLKEGDKLYVEDESGVTFTFIVRQSRTYDPGYAEEVFSLNDIAHLNLITCDGVWDGAKKSYTKRLVVFADILK